MSNYSDSHYNEITYDPLKKYFIVLWKLILIHTYHPSPIYIFLLSMYMFQLLFLQGGGDIRMPFWSRSTTDQDEFSP